MNLRNSVLLILCTLMALGCGRDFESKNSRNQSSQEVTPPTPPPKDDNEDRETPPTEIQNLKVCYYSPQNKSENCYNVIEPSKEQSKVDYKYKDPFTDPNFPKTFNPHQYVAPKRFLPINIMDGNLRLTQNFKINEFMQVYKGELALFSPNALFYIEQMREHVKKAIHVHSGYRSPKYNSSLSGTANWSRHMYGDALDFHIDGESFEDIAQMCLDFGATFYQIYEAHIHCDWRNAPLNDGFYDVTAHQRMFWNYKIQAQLASQINVEEEGGHWILSVDTPAIEDSELSLKYQWEIRYKNQIFNFSNSKVKLKKMSSGVYQVQVNVGGSMELHTQVKN